MKRSLLVVPLLTVFFSGCAFADGKDHEPMTDAKMMKDGSHMNGGHAMKEHGPAHDAKEMKDGTHMADGKPMQMMQAAGEMTDGEIKRITKGSKKLTIKHGEIKNLDMPPMTMVFSVSDEKMLEMVKKGDMIKFKVETMNGQMVVTKIVPQ